MSDGNFNRALLPHTPYQSGLLMGRRIMRQRAVQAFTAYLRETQPQLGDAELRQAVDRFSSRLGE